MDLSMNISAGPRGIAIIGMASVLAACASMQKDPPIQSLSGVDLYQQLCASCHGVEGTGDGPVAPLIKIPVPDLTRVSFRDGGEFPAEDLRLIIDGRSEHRAHGPRDMPVWGRSLYNSATNDKALERARTDAVIERLVEYLRSIQRQ